MREKAYKKDINLDYRVRRLLQYEHEEALNFGKLHEDSKDWNSIWECRPIPPISDHRGGEKSENAFMHHRLRQF